MDNYPEVASVEAKLRALDAADARCATETAPHTLVPIRPRSRGERRSLRTLPGVSLRSSLAFNPRPRRLSTPSDAYELHPPSLPSKEKRRLLEANKAPGDAWREDGLADVAFDVVEETEEERRGAGAAAPASAPASLRCLRVTFALKSATEPGAPVKCAQCGVAKPPSGFAAHQYKRAEFWASKGKNPNPNPPGGGDRDPDADDACHWDERGDGGGDRSWIRGTRRWEKDNRGGGGEDGGGEDGGGEAAVAAAAAARKRNRRGARCLECVAADPRVAQHKRDVERNEADASRVTCAACSVKFGGRNALFRHVASGPCREKLEAMGW
ncbi:uncharacterized protein MICPUCDRAFT_53047 [Micromonas pusilla CCMP1545]|uniref:Predicted protein n=1 Tax=Micromonas pusilla (strain CCMP1545) TaxID=564608 RepID=C1N5U8_MICPC|nr:uncharacterized protein MICPUCDRAFT_53047 [Micromonas pusilla CCMP1545]EEH52354.1 predicted protein [Micromonas pusilla CCMP1545]|eukprot:XP_003063218.1 predicted protein [Micromonas pusilla CCMP1545]